MELGVNLEMCRGATSGGSVSTTPDKLKDGVTSINNYSGGGGGCVNAYHASAGNLGVGGARGGSGSTSANSNASSTSYGSGGGGKKGEVTSTTFGLGANGVCFIFRYTN